MKKIDSVWIALLVMTYEKCTEKPEWELKDICFKQADIVKRAEKILGETIPPAMVSQHACAFSPKTNMQCQYEVAYGELRRLSYLGEFDGNKERPNVSEMDDNISVDTKSGNISIEKLIKFLDEDYTPRIKKIYEDFFSDNNLFTALMFIQEHGAEKYRTEKNAGNMASHMKLLEKEGKQSKKIMDANIESILKTIPRFKMTPNPIQWQDGRHIKSYYWAQFRKLDREDIPTSIAFYLSGRKEKGQTDRVYNIRVSVVAADQEIERNFPEEIEEQYNRHLRILDCNKKYPDVHFYVKGQEPGEFYIHNGSKEEILEYVKNHKDTKQAEVCKELIRPELDKKSGYEIFRFILQAIYELEDFYDAATDEKTYEEIEEQSIQEIVMKERKFEITENDKNVILYGPPGTGKTYKTAILAVSICDKLPVNEVAEWDYGLVMQRYEELKSQHRIEFTTFHQSYGYEEFIEGIKPVMEGDASEDDKDIQYKVSEGVFKKFCEHAMRPVMKADDDVGLNDSPTIWKVSLESTYDNPTRTECMKNEHIRIGYDGYGETISDDTDFNDGGKSVLNAFIYKMKKGDLVVSCYSNTLIDAVGVITGDYEWHDEYDKFKRLRKVNWLVKDIRADITKATSGTTLTLASVYKLSISINDVMDIVRENSSTDNDIEPNDNNYVFIIDEINRGNISKIFGELITLIEPTKRLGCKEAMSVKLPYSPKPFGVPNNVYLIGTMNTADRSIALMDTALRRRFRFVEMMPDTSVLRKIGADRVDDLDVVEMLDTINQRIALLYDREHTIGHAFFTRLKDDASIESLQEIFKKSVIPLLQEYFYEDYEKIQMILGDNGKIDPDLKFILDEKVTVKSIFKGSVDDSGIPEIKYSINDNAFDNIESYKQII